MKFHFIGIRGNAMPDLFIALKEKKNEVSVSEEDISDYLKKGLEINNILPRENGWFPDKITADLTAVIVAKNVKEDNPELQKALSLGLKIYSLAEFVYEISKDKTRVVIAGNHEKSRITAMILHVMKYHGKDINYLVRKPIDGLKSLVKINEENDFMLIEGDENSASVPEKYSEFQFFKPNIALISGISRDNTNVFPTIEDSLEQFQTFIASIVNGGILVYNQKDERLKDLVENSENPIRKHPYKPLQYHEEAGTCILETPEGEMPLEISGKENMSNLSGAKWICQHMGIDEDDFFEAISSFKDIKTPENF